MDKKEQFKIPRNMLPFILEKQKGANPTLHKQQV